MAGLDNNLIVLTNQAMRSGMDEMPRLARSDDVDNEFNTNNGMLDANDFNNPQIQKMRLASTQAVFDTGAIADLHQKTKKKLKADGLANLGAISLAGASLINQYVSATLKAAAQRAQAVQASPESKKIIGGLSEGGGEETTETTTDTQHAEESKKASTPSAGGGATSEAAQEAVEPGRENLPFSELGQASDLAKEKQKAYAQHELENQLGKEDQSEGQQGDQEQTGEQAPGQAQEEGSDANMDEMAMADQLHKEQAQQRQAQNTPEANSEQQQATVQQISEALQAGAASDPQLGEQLSQLGIAAGSKNSPRARQSALKRGREHMQQHLASKLMSLKFAGAPVALIVALSKDIVDAMEPTIITHIVNVIATGILWIILYRQQEWFYKKILTNMLLPIIAGIVAEAIPGLNILPVYTTEICILYIQSYVEYQKQKGLNKNVIPLMDKLTGEAGGASSSGSAAPGQQAA